MLKETHYNTHNYCQEYSINILFTLPAASANLYLISKDRFLI